MSKKRKKKFVGGTPCCGVPLKNVSGLNVCSKCGAGVGLFAERTGQKDGRPRGGYYSGGRILPTTSERTGVNPYSRFPRGRRRELTGDDT